MKKYYVLVCFAVAFFLLSACQQESIRKSSKVSIYEEESTVTTEQTTVVEETTQEATEEATVPAPQIVELTETYTVKIRRGDFPIYSGPGYENQKVATVEEAGIYTIVAECRNTDGVLWGRLKSGVGWVDLDMIRQEGNVAVSVTAQRANQALLSGGNYHYCDADSSEYSVTVVFRTNTLLYNVSFFQFFFEDAAYCSGPELYRLDFWDPVNPFVVKVAFPGLMSAWGLRFTDGNGKTQTYMLRDGGGLEENKDKVTFTVYNEPYKAYATPAETTSVPWKNAYLTYIEDMGGNKDVCEYRLVYVDGDDIPELFISGKYEALGGTVCSYKGGKVVSAHLHRIGGGSYIEKSGLVHSFNGHMGYYIAEIYRLTGGGFSCIFYGHQEDTYEKIINEAGQEENVTISKFFLHNGSEQVEVTEEAFFAAQAEIFDSNFSEALYYYDDSRMYTYDKIKQLIINW